MQPETDANRTRFRAVLYEALAGGDPGVRDASPLLMLARLTEGAEAPANSTRARLTLVDLSAVAAPHDVEAALAVAETRFGTPERFREAIYFARCLRRDGGGTQRLLDARGYVEEAAVPSAVADLHTDAAAVLDATTFGVLWAEPQRLDWMLATTGIWQREYAKVYAARHALYNGAVAGIAERMDALAPAAAALERLNGLRRLGPALGPAVLGRFQDLERLFACSIDEARLLDGLAKEPICRECGFRLGDSAPVAEARRVVQALERALAGQQARLAQRVVSRLLSRPADGDEERLARFIEVVQASDVSSLVSVLDDGLIEFLRALLEATDAGPVGVLDRLALTYPEVTAANLEAAVAEFRQLAEVEIERGGGRLRLARSETRP